MSETKTVTRVVSLPIRGVMDTGEVEHLNLLDMFRPAWQMATDLANWATRELACRDSIRNPDMETLPKYDREAMFGTVPRRFGRKASDTKPAQKAGDPQVSNLYDLWTREYPARIAWDGSTVNARDILKAVEETWIHHKSFGRFAVMWKGQARPMVFRFPYPWPIPADKGKTVRLSRADGERREPFVSIPFLTPHDRIVLRLADGREFKRQAKSFDYLIAHPERLGQAKICALRMNGKLVGVEIKIVGKFDPDSPTSDKIAICETGKDSLVRCHIEGEPDKKFIYNGDELRAVIAVHDEWGQRFSEDMKFEKRWPSKVRTRRFQGPVVQGKRERAANRLRTARQTLARQLVRWCIRQGVAELRYDDSEKGFLPRFDWSGLRAMLRCNCEGAGLSFQHQAEVEDE